MFWITSVVVTTFGFILKQARPFRFHTMAIG